MRLFTIVIFSLVSYSVSGATLGSQVKLGNGISNKNNSSVTSVSQVKLNNGTAETEIEVTTDSTVAQSMAERIGELLKEIEEVLINTNTTTSIEPRPPVNLPATPVLPPVNPPKAPFVLPPIGLPKPPSFKPNLPSNLPRPSFGLPHPPSNKPRPPFGLPQPPFRPDSFDGPKPFPGFGPQRFINQNERFGGRFGGNPGFGFRQNW